MIQFHPYRKRRASKYSSHKNIYKEYFYWQPFIQKVINPKFTQVHYLMRDDGDDIVYEKVL